MTLQFRTDPDLDDQTPARRQVSAYRRCKSMLNPRWPVDNSAGSISTTTAPLRRDNSPWSIRTQPASGAPPVHRH
ncbi:MAG TPA: hypothetical protein VGE70_10435 [Burkholderiaceae bacterium]